SGVSLGTEPATPYHLCQDFLLCYSRQLSRTLFPVENPECLAQRETLLIGVLDELVFDLVEVAVDRVLSHRQQLGFSPGSTCFVERHLRSRVLVHLPIPRLRDSLLIVSRRLIVALVEAEYLAHVVA